MADLSVKGLSNKKHRCMFLEVLPNELLVEIIAKVASSSIVDLCRVKLTCKQFLHAAEDDYVYQHVSMDKFPLVPLAWFTNEKILSFFKRCRESKNLEILYRDGMVQYFKSMRVKSGLENLKKAALGGQDEAKYVYCMLLMMCCEDQQERKHGFDLFYSLKTFNCVSRCRERVKSFIKSMWGINNLIVRNHKLSLCHSNTCCNSVRLQKLSRRWSWLVEDEDGDGDNGISCQYCDGNYELSLFCKMFKV
ncbi:putative F-box protein At1g67623 [Gastrolobium bilobum]|uniref:putative F-box protein At1g67623 n=1 Tax=Gastrolobium bilobum TaxID=150636 RepID=UPI002AB1E3C6|nr:putative F-box protein At1g67623 [Gastrolobium bilobum]